MKKTCTNNNGYDHDKNKQIYETKQRTIIAIQCGSLCAFMNVFTNKKEYLDIV